jgi:hypothetical protein
MPVNVVLVPDDLPLSGKLVYTEQGLSTDGLPGFLPDDDYGTGIFRNKSCLNKWCQL